MSNEQSGIDWAKAVMAGAVATVAMTIVMMLMGTDIMKGLGSMMVGPDAGAMAYVAGGIMHFMIGVVYGIVYSVIAPKLPMPSIASGLLFGAVLTPVAMFSMPIVAGMLGGGGDNPCGNPCSNPCGNPCASIDGDWTPAYYQDGNPCNPCGDNPCNPCGDNPCAANPCAANPCGGNPCNPCGGGGGMNPWVSSFINHLIFGLVLGLMYKPKDS